MQPAPETLPHSRVIPANACRRERWRNGLGWTREVLSGSIAGPPDDAGWDWRLSIAEIEAEAAYSRFEGVDREQMLLSGSGLRLIRAGGDTLLMPPHERVRFSGEEEMTAQPVDGRVEVVNLMWRRDRVEVASWHRPLVGPMVIFAEPRSTWAVHLIAGQARFDDDSGLPPLASGDTAIFAAGDARLRHVLDGGGEAWLIRLAARVQ